jgi:thiol-disulfide isomerase/thioredoxin
MGSMRPCFMRLIVVALALLVASPAAAQPTVLSVGQRLAELDVAVDGDGKPFKLKSLKGKWVLVTVGAEWCKPCAKELPAWDKLAGILKDKITFVAIGVDDDVKDGQRFHKRLKLKHMKLVYMPADKSATASRYGSNTMPSSFVADGNQVIKFRKDGFNERDPDGELKKMHAQLNKLLEK